MPSLTVHWTGPSFSVPFEGQPLLHSLLEEAGLAQPRPCGGHGQCGKCAVEISGAISEPDEQEKALGKRLSCRLRLLGDAQVRLLSDPNLLRIAVSAEAFSPQDPMPGEIGAAIDLGTTTIATVLYHLKTGAPLASVVGTNHQRTIAADVMGRISAAKEGAGETLQKSVLRDLSAHLPRETQPQSLVITGNTTMLYLLTGQDPDCLSHVPFRADRLFDEELPLLGGTAYLPPCISAFVGADICCAILSSGMLQSPETALLCDIGTNGEVALWKNGRLYVTSTAAGPAFEGAGISCGCSSVSGAIEKVSIENGNLRIHTIGKGDPVGLCGSGLIDALAVALELGLIDETGALEGDIIPLSDKVCLTQQDIRSAQLAKAAIAAGIETLLQTADCRAEDLERIYIAGGFGNHLNIRSAMSIGLLPTVPTERVQSLGNAALRGACQTLLRGESRAELRRIAALAEPVNLGGNPHFNELFSEHMLFPEPS